jgi:hypothetical protein
MEVEMIKRIVFTAIIALTLVILSVSPVFAGDFAVKNWRVFNVMPATAKYWDINPVKSKNGDIQFPIQQFDSKTTGSFTVYFLGNDNRDLTGKTMGTDVSWTGGTYETRSTVFPEAYVRFWFQDVASGNYDSNDYWWCTLSLDLNNATFGSMVASLADRTIWTNQSGKSATDTTVDWLEWQGDIVHMSPYDGFTKAMKNVKQLGLSFGSSGSYASGVAVDGGTGVFTVSSFTITP